MTSRNLIFGLLAVLTLSGQDAEPRLGALSSEETRRWIVILDEQPLAALVKGRAELLSTRILAARERIEDAQYRLSREAEHRGLQVIGSTQTVLNAVFVRATAAEAAELAFVPGVRRVVASEPAYRAGNRALEIVKVQDAWSIVGGVDKAGQGTKIGIVDTGIDQTHAAFQDASIPEPSGGRLCKGADCDFTSNKVIAARSYVRMLALPEYPEDSRPDDLSPRDRVGHGTAIAMLAAGVVHDAPLAKLSGVAPKAWLGNYKVFGSPGVNDVTFTDVIAKALEDALYDGMDAVTLSLAFPAVFGPNDTAPTDCADLPNGTPCDSRVAVVKNAARLGLTVIAAAGNDGDLAVYLPALNSISSPGTTPEAITVGASTNSHSLYQTARLESEGAPANLMAMKARFGDGPRPVAAITAPIKDVAALEDNGQACSPLARGSLNGAIALIQADGCTTRKKVKNAQDAGAIAVLFMRATGKEFVFAPTGLEYTGIPLMLVGNTDGTELRAFLKNDPNRQVTLDPAITEAYDSSQADFVAYFSSYGPDIGTNGIKPDLVAPGTNLYVATQKFDPNSDMYDASGYMAIQGTSFSVGLVAGAVALSRQLFPNLTRFPESDRPAILKSSVVNTTTDLVKDVNPQGEVIDASVVGMGSGRLYVPNALTTPITVSPATLSFGLLTTRTFPQDQSLVITNHSDKDMSITLSVRRYATDNLARFVITPSSFTLRAGAVSQPVRVRLEGSPPNPGSYDGRIVITANNFEIGVPYLYLVTDGIPYNVIPVRNFDFVGQVGQRLRGGLLFKVVDRYGVPVSNVPVQWSYVSGGGSIVGVWPMSGGRYVTDVLGISEAYEVYLGNQLGEQAVEVRVPNLPTLRFLGTARLQPVIETGGVVNSASGRQGQGLAPGSIISIFGRGLSEFTLAAAGPSLPLALGGISVSFDDKDLGISLPGRLAYVSESRVDVQLPWELEGLTNIKTKVSLDGFTSSPLMTAPLANVSPAFWLFTDPDTGQQFLNARNEDGSRITSANRAAKGSLVRLMGNGLGPVDNRPASGEPASAELPCPVRGSTSVTIGGVEVTVESARLLPGAVGIYEIAVRLPADMAGGLLPTVVTVNGISSPEARLPVQE